MGQNNCHINTDIPGLVFLFCPVTQTLEEVLVDQPNKSQCYEGDGYLAKIGVNQIRTGIYLGCRRL